MKYYLTKEWFYDIISPLMLKNRIEVNKAASKGGEETYQHFYETCLADFIKREKKICRRWMLMIFSGWRKHCLEQSCLRNNKKF